MRLSFNKPIFQEGQRERSMSGGDGEYYGEELPVEEERFVSDLMEATTIGKLNKLAQYVANLSFLLIKLAS